MTADTDRRRKSTETKEDIQRYIQEQKERVYDTRVSHFIKEVRALSLPKTIKATRLLLTEMSSEKGFQRHDGRDYFVHPIAIAQTALDYELISNMMSQGDVKKADTLLSACLLHDIIEDVEYITYEYVKEEFGQEIADNVDNVTKREADDEAMIDYLIRVSSHEISSLVKILDRLNNVATLSNSSLKHRERQLEETRMVYIPLTKHYRRQYWEYGNFFFQARTIMNSILAEVERGIVAENKVIELTKEIENLKKD